MENEKNLSEKSMEAVVGGVKIDGKDVSDAEYLKTVKLSRLKARLQPVVHDYFEFHLKNKDGSYTNFLAHRENGGQFKVQADIPSEAHRMLEKVSSVVNSFEDHVRIPALKDIPIYDDFLDDRLFLYVEEVLAIKGVKIDGIGWRGDTDSISML